MVDRIVVPLVGDTEKGAPNVKTGDVVVKAGDADKGVLEVKVREGDVKSGEGDKTDRPEGLPEKFESVEAMVKAYGELEVKLGQTPEQKAADEKAVADKVIADKAIADAKVSQAPADLLAKANTEFGEKGFLSPETFAELDKAGIPKARIEEYIEGRKAVADQQSNMLQEIAGSEEILKATIQWASANMTEAEAAAYNNILDSGNTEALKMAFEGVFAKYSAAVGVDGDLVAGEGLPGGGAGAKPFGSQQEVIDAMNTKGYKTDPAVRKVVEQRLAVTEMFGVK